MTPEIIKAWPTAVALRPAVAGCSDSRSPQAVAEQFRQALSDQGGFDKPEPDNPGPKP